MAMIYALAFICLFGNALGQIRLTGSCPVVDVVPDFNVTKFMGRWYMGAWYGGSTPAEMKCVTLDISLRQNGTAIVAIETVISTETGVQTTIPSVFRIPDPIEPGKIKTVLSWQMNENNLWITGTDYVNFVVLDFCDDEVSSHVQRVAVYVRDPNQYESVMTNIDEIIKKTHHNRTLFMPVKHDNCDVQPVSNPRAA